MDSADASERDIRPGRRIADYVVDAALGDGGMGRVFAATHISTGLRVAIKTLLSQDANSTEYFRREIETLSALRHPAVVRFHDHGIHCAQPWYAMDLLEGVTLRDVLAQASSAAATDSERDSWIRTAPVRPSLATEAGARPVHVEDPASTRKLVKMSPEQLLHICSEVLVALDYVHGAGVVHGDIKPENIFLRAKRQPVLVDFGVASAFDRPRERLALVPHSIGSVAYMSPERLRGAMPDARADLYAVGCLMYECLTGRHPFLRSTIDATILAHLNAAVVPPSDLRPSIPRKLEALILRLLSKAPSDRPGYARDALEVLWARDPTNDEPPARSSKTDELPASSAPSSYLYRTPLVGRAAALDVLRGCLGGADAGKGAKVLVRAGSGLGKTRLVLELGEVALRAGYSVIHLECEPSAESNARPWLGPLQTLLRALTAHRRAKGRSSQLAASRAALETLTRRDAEHSPEPERIAAAREDLILNLASEVLDGSESQTLLLAVDDVQHADEITRDLLLRLASSTLEGRRLLLVCTDSGELTARDGAFTGHFRELLLDPLTESEVELAIRSALAVEYPSLSLVQEACHVSQGNPLVLGHYLRALIGAGVLQRDRHQGFYLKGFPGASGATVEAQQIESVNALFELRVEELSPAELRLAGIAALLNTSFDAQTLVSVTGCPESEVKQLLSSLCRRQIVELSATRYRFTHPSLISVLARRASVADAKRIHRRVAAVFLRAELGGSAPGALAFHLSRSGSHGRAAHFYAEAARRYLQIHRRKDALSFFDAAIAELAQFRPRGSSTARELPRLHEELGDVATALRQYSKAAAAYRRALELSGGETLCRARLFRKLAGAHQREADRGIEHLKQAASLLSDAESASHELEIEWIQVNLDTMWVHYWKQETTELLAIADRISPRVEATGTAKQRASLYFTLTVGLMQRHRYVTGPNEVSLIERALSIYEALDDRPSVAMCRFVRSMALLFAGDLDGAEAGFEAVLEVAEKATSITIRVRALTFLCLVHRRRRAKERVRRLAAAARSLASEHEMPEYRGTAMANLAWVAFHDGELAECERLVRDAIVVWDASPLNVFRWTGLLPLLAAILGREAQDDDHLELIRIAEGLLQESQQRLPDGLTHVLVELRCASEPSSARLLGSAVIARAVELAFM